MDELLKEFSMIGRRQISRGLGVIRIELGVEYIAISNSKPRNI